MQGEQWEYHFHQRQMQETEVYERNKACRLKALLESPEIHASVHKGVIIASTGNVVFELGDISRLVDILDESHRSLFSAIICDSRATNRYLFMTHEQRPNSIDELNAVIEACQNFFMENHGGWNGIEVQNSINVRVSTYKPAWHDDPFSLMRAKEFGIDRHAAAHREIVETRHLTTVLPPPKARTGVSG